jgi:ABC-type transporter Mla maintaining outer membrane lipid asymmetry ATPase subunit MlaF
MCQRCDPERFSFATSAELEDLPGVIGQGRAIDAIRFGIQHPGYNLYVIGPAGIGKHAAVRHLLEEGAQTGQPAKQTTRACSRKRLSTTGCRHV